MPQAFNHLKPGKVRHLYIQEDKVGQQGFDLFDRLSPLDASPITSTTSICSSNRFFISRRAAGSSSITMALNNRSIFHQFIDMDRHLFPGFIAELHGILVREQEVKFIKETFNAVPGVHFIGKRRAIVRNMHH